MICFDPKQAVLAIHHNLSGREISSPATKLGLARVLLFARPLSANVFE
ncbi:hypothetical protein LMG28138_03843 [Pararobbsia alpina]|uniref:Uncharacterized protein n=1 Tax=Pararobbsia alpina TaxID=621374 RepID=A0A6S7BCE5_9BURK|nr:hypothetical protein LMG28138_03843 [Pararobbsia alpina]